MGINSDSASVNQFTLLERGEATGVSYFNGSLFLVLCQFTI